MSRRLLMGNEAFGLGAVKAGANVVCGYPGTPSTEVLETVAKVNPGQQIHVEWSTNEKAALELAAGASYCGARCLVTMKQVGLNVASDPLMSLCYVGVKGGVVLLVADDPGPISSQTEQDTRRFGSFSKVPVLDPTSPVEAYSIMGYAFELSERHATPVIVRSSTRVSHGSAVVDVEEGYEPHSIEGFERDPKWVIFPKRSYLGHLQINERLPRIADEYHESGLNTLEIVGIASEGQGDASSAEAEAETETIGIACGGSSYAYVREVLERSLEFGLDAPGIAYKVLKVATPFPFPKKSAAEFLAGIEHVICIEELDHVIEDELIRLCGERHLGALISGKLDGRAKAAGENSVDSVAADLRGYMHSLGLLEDHVAGCGQGEDGAHPGGKAERPADAQLASMLPPRPPVLCAGCPHRGAFYAVKKATEGKLAHFSGDIGCYTLGNAMPLDMVDNCLCMGAGINMAQGMGVAEPDSLNFAFVGDSTFFASGMTGVVNSIYNGNPIKLMVLDNSTTAMTGHQPHPGTGIRMSERSTGRETSPISIRAVLEAIGVNPICECHANDLDETTAAVKDAIEAPGTAAVIFKDPCAAVVRTGKHATVNQEKCTACKKCIRKLGCPAIVLQGGVVHIDESLCNACGLCTFVCSADAIETGEN